MQDAAVVQVNGHAEDDGAAIPDAKISPAVESLRGSVRKRRASIAVWSDPRLMEFAQGAGRVEPEKNKSPLRSAEEEPLETPNYFDRLEEYHYLKIFSYLSIRDLLKCRRVCKTWQFYITNEQLQQHIDLSLNHKQVNDLAVATVSKFAGENLRVLNLRNCWNISDAALRSIVSLTPNIEVLDLNSCWELTDQGITNLSKGCRKLRSLDLSNCKKMMDSAIAELTTHLPALQELRLSYCKSLTNTSMESIIRNASNLRLLNLQRCTGISDAGFSLLREQQFGLRNLMALMLCDCSFLTDEAMASIAAGCPQLRFLNLSFCCALSSKSLEHLGSGCKRLEAIDLSYCGNAVTDDGLKVLAGELMSLRKISLRGCVLLTVEGLQALAQLAPQIEAINVTSCRNITQEHVETLPWTWKFLTGNTPLENFDGLGLFAGRSSARMRRFTT